MNPIAQARLVYALEPCARSFLDDLEAHLGLGFVYSTPDFFVMGRPVQRSAPAHLIIDPSVSFERSVCDCWHVYLAAGNLGKAWGILPWPLEWLSFERKNELRFYKASDIRRLSLGNDSQP